jgi:hypothetical protein
MEILYAFIWVNMFVVPWKLLMDWSYHDTVSTYRQFQANIPVLTGGIPVYVDGKFWGYIYL